MKDKIHPEYMDCVVTCACGNTFTTRSTVPQLNIEICGNCHPFYTGKQKFVDTAGRVEKFQKRYGWGVGTEREKKEEPEAAETREEAGAGGKTDEGKPVEAKQETPASDSADS